MSSIKNILKKNYHYIAFGIFLIVSAILSCYTHLRNIDDIYYYIAAKSGIDNFIPFLKWHYFNQNGRLLIHSIEMFALYFNGIPWKVLNPISMGTIAFFTAKTVANKSFDFKKALFCSSVLFMALDFGITKGTIYWISASFNYVFPCAFISMLFYLCKENRNSCWLPFVALISGMLMEQTGMIAVGCLFLTVFAEKFIKKSKPEKRMVISFILSIIGLLSNLLAPATFKRLESEKIKGDNIISLIFDEMYNHYLHENWLNTKSIIFMSVFSLSMILLLFRIQKETSKKFGIFSLIAVGQSTFMVLNWIAEITGYKSSALYTVVLLMYLLLMSISLFLTTIYSIKYFDSFIPLFSIILGLGAQIMLVVISSLGTRIMYPSVICFMFYIMFSLSESIIIVKKTVRITLIIIISCVAVVNSYNGMSYLKSYTNNTTNLRFPENYINEDYRLEYIENHSWYEGDNKIVISWITGQQ